MFRHRSNRAQRPRGPTDENDRRYGDDVNLKLRIISVYERLLASFVVPAINVFPIQGR